MPDPLDTLRHDIAEVLWTSDAAAAEDEFVITSAYFRYSRAVLEWLAGAALDTVRLRAILELIGLEVREGWMHQWPEGTWAVNDNAYYPDIDIVDDEPVLVCRVRPQGEANDA